jgi:hypothetical protein
MDIINQLLGAGFTRLDAIVNTYIYERKNLRAIVVDSNEENGHGRLYFEVISSEMFLPEIIADFVNEDDFFMPPRAE